MNNIFDTPPVYVNEQGTKWWRDQDINAHLARKKNLAHYQCFFVEHADGERTRLLVDPNGLPVKEAPGLEAMAAFIDLLSVSFQLEPATPVKAPKPRKRK